MAVSGVSALRRCRAMIRRNLWQGLLVRAIGKIPSSTFAGHDRRERRRALNRLPNHNRVGCHVAKGVAPAAQHDNLRRLGDFFKGSMVRLNAPVFRIER